MTNKHHANILLALILIGLVALLLATLLPSAPPTQAAPPAQATIVPALPTRPPTPVPPVPTLPPPEVPEGDTLLLFGSGLSGLGIWLSWQRWRMRGKRK